MNFRRNLLYTCLLVLFSFPAFARLRISDCDYIFSNQGTNEIVVTSLRADSKALLECGILIPLSSKSVSNAGDSAFTLPHFFEIEFKDSHGLMQTDRLDTAWIRPSKAKLGSIFFVYTPENRFVLKIYLDTGGEQSRLDGLLLPDEDNPALKSYKELVRAAIDGNAQRVNQLLTNGTPCAWPNEPVGLTPLGYSVRWNRQAAFDVLIRQIPADFNPYAYCLCIQQAASLGEIDILKRLLQSDLAENIPKFQLQEIFYDTCYHPTANDVKVLKILLDHFKVGINYQTRDFGHTLLFVAIDSGDLKLIKWLLEQGADPNAKLRNGETPLRYARNEAVKKLLTEYGAR